MQDLDEDIIKQYFTGNQEALKSLIDRHTPSIYNYSVRFVGRDHANDITQEVFIKVWRNLKKFDINKSQFKTWLFTITRNTITDYLRKKKMILFSTLDKDEENFADNIKDEAILPDEVYQKLQDKEILNRALDELKDNYKTVLTLYYQEDMTFKEIGEVLGKPLNTVKSYHFRAIQKLKEICTKINN